MNQQIMKPKDPVSECTSHSNVRVTGLGNQTCRWSGGFKLSSDKASLQDQNQKFTTHLYLISAIEREI